jgi:predicted HicB family RNase H-like nuclease
VQKILRKVLDITLIIKYPTAMNTRKKKTRMGRPCFPAGKAKTKPVLIRLTPAMHKMMSEAAKRAGKPLTTWLRDSAAQLLKGE